MLYDIIIIGSGPNGLLFNYYITKYYPYLKTLLITKKKTEFHCTYGVFFSHINKTWFLDHIPYKYLKVYNTKVSCPKLNNPLMYNNRLISSEKYVLLDNEIYNFLIDSIENHSNSDIKEIDVIDIQKNNRLSNVLYYSDNILKSLQSKIVIEATGHHSPIGVSYPKYNINYQVFYGKEINCYYPHGIKDVILLDWYNPHKNNNIPSFAYIIPLNSYTILIEETILITNNISDSLYDYLESRLNKRIKDYKISIKKVVRIEKNTIILNRTIPKFDSISFGIGPAGNMLNPLSGYTIGYNIYHIPEIAKLIIENRFNTEDVYRKYWNINRRIIYNLNLIGTKLMLTFDQNKFCNFHSHFFKNYDSNLFKILFLNCNVDNSIYKLFVSSRVLLNYPFYYILTIIKLLIIEFVNIYYLVSSIVILFTIFIIYR